MMLLICEPDETPIRARSGNATTDFILKGRCNYQYKVMMFQSGSWWKWCDGASSHIYNILRICGRAMMQHLAEEEKRQENYQRQIASKYMLTFGYTFRYLSKVQGTWANFTFPASTAYCICLGWQDTFRGSWMQDNLSPQMISIFS